MNKDQNKKTIKKLLHLDKFKVYNFDPGELEIPIKCGGIRMNSINWIKLRKFVRKNSGSGDYFIGGRSNSIFRLTPDDNSLEFVIISYQSFNNKSYTKEYLEDFVQFLIEGMESE